MTHLINRRKKIFFVYLFKNGKLENKKSHIILPCF